jgi:hypothetical protein
MLGEQTLLCQTEAGEIVPNTLDELVCYLDIEGFGDDDEQATHKSHTMGGDQLPGFTTFGTEDMWPI